MKKHNKKCIWFWNYINRLLIICGCLLLFSCGQTDPKLSSAGTINNSVSQNEKSSPLSTENSENPPVSYVNRLINDSKYIVLVNVTTVDSIYLAEKVFKANVLKTFKGELKKGDKVAYFVMNEMKHIKHPNDTLVVFLNKSKKAGSGLAGDEIYFYTPENSSFIYTKFIDSVLTKN